MQGRRLLYLVGALVLVETMFYAVLVPLLPYYQDEFGLSKTSIGLLSAFYAIGAVIFSIPAGFLVTRFGSKRMVIAGVVLLAVSSVAFGFGRSIIALDASRFLQGVAGSLLWAGGLAWLVSSSEPDKRGQLIGTVVGIGIAGSLLGPVLGAAATLTSPQLIFSAIAAVIAALGVWTMTMDAVPPGPADTLRDLARATRQDSRLWMGMWLTLLPSTLFGLMEVLSPLRMDELGASAVTIAAIFIGASILEAVLSPVFGRAADRFGAFRIARYGVWSCVAVALLITIPVGLVPYAAMIVLACIAFGAPWVPASAMLSSATEATGLGQGIAFALWNLAWGAGQAIGAFAGGGIAEATSDAVPYSILAATCLLTLILYRTAQPEKGFDMP